MYEFPVSTRGHCPKLPRLRWFAVCSSATDGLTSVSAARAAAQVAPHGSGALTEKVR